MSKKLDELIKLMEEYKEQFPGNEIEGIAQFRPIENMINILKNRKGRMIIIYQENPDEIDGETWRYEE